MPVNKKDLQQFDRARWTLIVVSAFIFCLFFAGFAVFDSPIFHTVLVVAYVSWGIFFVRKNYRCPKCRAIPRLPPFMAIDLGPKICRKCGLDFGGCEPVESRE